MPAAARLNDMATHNAPHCHAPMHPNVPQAHPPIPLGILEMTVPNVVICGQPAAVVGSMTKPCTLPGCAPGGPGLVAKGSATVQIGNLPAARVNDPVAFPACVAPIPSPTGKILPPGAPTVMIGG